MKFSPYVLSLAAAGMLGSGLIAPAAEEGGFGPACKPSVLISPDKDKNAEKDREEKKKKAYRAKNMRDACEYVLEMAVSCTEHIYIDLSALSKDNQETVYDLLMNYRFADTSSHRNDGKDGVAEMRPEYKSCVRMLKYTRDDTSIELTDTEKAALAEAEKILKELDLENNSCTEKAKKIHDWLVANCSYDESGSVVGERGKDCTYDAYDGKFMLLQKKGVCDSYAQAYWLLLQMAGVPSSMMSGTMNNGMRHAWNLVFLDDHWAHVDTTHDDPLPDEPLRVNDDYFDKTDSEMSATRTWEMELFPNSEFSELFSAQNDIYEFSTVSDFISFINKQKGNEDQEYTVEIAELQGERDFDKKIQQASDRVNTRGQFICTQDPLFPRAIRVKHSFRENSKNKSNHKKNKNRR